MDNIELVRGWLKLALEDWASIIELDYKKHRGVVVYHSQQFVEKLCKAIIASLGFEPPKTHTPSVEIDSIIAEYRLGNTRVPLNETLINMLEQISSLAKTLEDERTRPRYGVRHHDRIIPPNEYYSEDQVKLLLDDAKYVSKLVHRFLESLNYCDKLNDLCGELSAIGETEF